jgi:hypothetical protein
VPVKIVDHISHIEFAIDRDRLRRDEDPEPGIHIVPPCRNGYGGKYVTIVVMIPRRKDAVKLCRRSPVQAYRYYVGFSWGLLAFSGDPLPGAGIRE